MPRALIDIIAHIRMVSENPNISTTLIQTEDLIALCEAAETPGCGMTTRPVAPSQFVLRCLEEKSDWKEQRFEFYAAHFLVGSGLIGGNLDGNIRGLTAAFKKQYDVGVEHGSKHEQFAAADVKQEHDHG